jgi:hypothetical protein
MILIYGRRRDVLLREQKHHHGHRFFPVLAHGCSAARSSPACKGNSLRCLRKCRFAYIDTSPALSARRHVTAALRYSARPPQRPSRSHLGCQTHQTYCFRTSSEPPRLPLVACCAHQVQRRRGLWGLGFNKQIFGVDEQVPGRKSERLRSVRPNQ